MEPVADKMTIALKIDFRIQGFSRAEVEHYEERCRKQYIGMPCGPKPFRTISFFLELISRFEFDVRRCGFFFERFEFLVCSKFNHTQCGRACACAVACLCPHNSDSNVVVFVTIHDHTYIYTHFSPKIYVNVNVYVHIYVYGDVYVYVP